MVPHNMYWILIFTLVSSLVTENTGWGLYKIYIKTANVEQIRYIRENLDIWSVSKTNDDTVFVVALTDAKLSDFKKLTYDVKIEFLSKPTITNSKRRQAQRTYRDFDAATAALYSMEQRYPSLAKVYILGKSYEGRNILGLKVGLTPTKNDESKPEIVYVGMHHAREWISVEVVLDLAENVLCTSSDETRVSNFLLQNSELWFIPVLNPDGFSFTFGSGNAEDGQAKRLWRKNRRPPYGVDLNRNYGYLFGGPGSSDYQMSDVYHGTAAFSEPETTILRDFLGYNSSGNWILPMNNLMDNPLGMISYHSYGQEILYPIGGSYQVARNEPFMKQLTSKMATIIASHTGKIYTARSAADMYLAAGDACDWFWSQQGKIAITIELRPNDDNVGFLLPATEIQDTVRENIPAALYFGYYLVSNRKETNWLTHTFQNNLKDWTSSSCTNYMCSCSAISTPSMSRTQIHTISRTETSSQTLSFPCNISRGSVRKSVVSPPLDTKLSPSDSIGIRNTWNYVSPTAPTINTVVSSQSTASPTSASQTSTKSGSQGLYDQTFYGLLVVVPFVVLMLLE